MTDHYLNPVVPQNYYEHGHDRRFFRALRARLDAEGPPESHRPARTLALRHSQRTGAAGQPASGRTRTTSKPWESFPTSTPFRRTSWRTCAAWCATTQTISIPTRIRLPSWCSSTTGFARDISREPSPFTTATMNGKRASNRTTCFLHENFSYIITDIPMDTTNLTPSTPLTFAFRRTARTSNNRHLSRI